MVPKIDRTYFAYRKYIFKIIHFELFVLNISTRKVTKDFKIFISIFKYQKGFNTVPYICIMKFYITHF